ncbi:hypothetical protein FOZ60_000596 [Perkinsus olseni]|uniref:Rab-GAP TBC domain-containing protein n=1 Tax=Perkinsus olseni TaxID=32597 RepID=A0A7J6P320_PEROL|nr:hypothetical protein FOZ60_000596 [Perkinsus olseni]
MAILLDTLKAIPDFLFGPEDPLDQNVNENKLGTPSTGAKEEDEEEEDANTEERPETQSSEHPRDSSVESTSRSPSVSSDWNLVDLSGESLFKLIVDRHPLAVMNQSLSVEDSTDDTAVPEPAAEPPPGQWSLLPSADDLDRLRQWEKVVADRPLEEVHRSELRPLVHAFGVPVEYRPRLWRIWATKRLHRRKLRNWHAWEVSTLSDSPLKLGYSEALASLRGDESASLDSRVVRQIEMDLPRTATGDTDGAHNTDEGHPDGICFTEVIRAGGDRLRGRVLGLSPSVGYCQGMNFVVNALLSVPPPGLDDETAYLVLAAFVEGINRDYYDKKNLRGFLRDISRLDEILGEQMPEVKKMLDRLEISRLWLCAEPMLCLWSKSLQMHPARLWDVFLLDGTDAVLAAMLASISLAYPKIESCLSEEEQGGGRDGRQQDQQRGKSSPTDGDAVETSEKGRPKQVKSPPLEVLQERVVTTFKGSLRDMDVEQLARETVEWIQPCHKARRKAKEAQHRVEAERKLIAAGYGFAPLSFAWRSAEE